MSHQNNQSNPLSEITFVRDITLESAAAISGGGNTPTDVTLFTDTSSNTGNEFGSDRAVSNLADVGFNDSTGFIAVNNSKTWRFYEDANFEGDFIDVGPNEARRAGDFGFEISSFKSIS